MANTKGNEALRDIAALGGSQKTERNDMLQRALKSIRTHLAMDVAFISEFSGNRRTFRYVDCDRTFEGMRPGVSCPLDETYCKRVVSGELPEMSGRADVSAVPPDPVITAAIPLRSYASIPLRLSDGSLFGTFCAIGVAENDTLNPRDLAMMHAFAEMAAEQIEIDLNAGARRREVRARVRDVLENDRLVAVYQPIFDLSTGAVVGHEALVRFTAMPERSPDVWFSEAAEAGLGAELELRAIEKALAGLPDAPPSTYISVNVSPAHVASGRFAELLDAVPSERVVLEITEHATIADYGDVVRACETLRSRGIRLAIDDAGSGDASFRHILSLSPDLIKLDMSLVHGIESDAKRQALAAAFVGFGAKTGSEIVAEGVETHEALETLKALGVTKAQGYLLGRPGPFERTNESR